MMSSKRTAATPPQKIAPQPSPPASRLGRGDELGLRESDVNLIAERTVLEGKILLPEITRVHGSLKGEVIAPEGSELIIAETGLVDGSIDADTIFIDGFVRGDVRARKRIIVSASGRVVGNLSAPSVSLAFGSFFEGRCVTQAQ